MLDHISLPCRDLGRTAHFYDTALAALGYSRVFTGEKSAGWGEREEGFAIKLRSNFAAEDGLHVAFRAPSRAAVREFHRFALQAGGQNHGEPGLRPHYGPNYYAAFVLDPDGHVVEAVCHLESES